MSDFRFSVVALVTFLFLGCVSPLPLPPSLDRTAAPAPGDLESQAAPPVAAPEVAPAVASPEVPAAVREMSSLPIIATTTPGDLFQPDSKSEYNMSCEEFFDLLKTSRATSIEEALAAIQKKRPKFLTRAVYAYQTKNPYDAASDIFPRAVVYGGDAKMVLNFGGARRLETYDRLEAMCFDDKKSQFDFYDIVFVDEALSPRRGGDKTDLKDLTEDEKKLKQVIIANGRDKRECARCHQTPARPIWDTYALWPGFYGGIDDALRDPDRPDPRPIYAKLERMGWDSFQAIKGQNKRYNQTSQELVRANSDFSLRLSYLNGRRIVGDLKHKGPAFESHKYEFAKALFCAPKAERHFFSPMAGESNTGITFNVLPTHSDMFTKDIFLDAYDDEMKKERRLSEILEAKGYPSPLPRERVERLRLYYRELFPDKELNLDLRLSSVDADEVLLMRELQKVTEKLEIEMDNWSMTPSGGFSHENGLGGDGKVALRLILERPFMNEFLKENAELVAAITAREASEQAYYAADGKGHTPEAASVIEQGNAKICALIAKKIP